ncbi:MAG: YbaB/EbfC family nucleoid-associated protein [Treponema sp.]|jgi:DNA-binding YbaB/EbfC family protein|nr:YbaB/EbfC family nucleoid-associated protein [Treponema sp.]
MNINPFDILKNAQKLQEQMGNLQEKLGGIAVTGSAGGGMVEIDLNGKMEVIAVRIEQAVVNPRDVPMLQDLVAAAFSDGLEKAKEAVNREVGAMAGIPGGMFPGFPGPGGVS